MISIQERLGLSTEPIEGALWQWACMLRTAMPGTVVSFDSAKQTCVVQPDIQEIVLLPPPSNSQVPNPGTTQNIPTNVTIQPIQDVPIVMMRVPGWSITLPITVGTECLLIFSDMCIDGWWQNGGINPQYKRRRHDLSDAMALFGPWSQPKVLSNYSTTSLQIRSDDQQTLIDLAPGQITINASSKVHLQSPEIDADNGGTTQKLLTDAFYQYLISGGFHTWVTNATTIINTLGHGTLDLPVAPPGNSETTILKGQ